MLAHVVEVLREVVDEVVVVSSPELVLPDVRARVVVDREPHLGPLAGIREGLLAIESGRAYATSTDAPFLTPGFVRALLAFGGAAAPEVGGFVQPLAAVYPKSAVHEAERRMAQGSMSAHGLLEAIGFRRVAAEELPDLDALRSLDTPAGYLEAVRGIEPHASAVVELRGRRREVPIGTLAELLARAAPELAACVDGELPRGVRVSLPGLECARDARAPVGPGERVIVREAD
jgi:molybdopterin-guanine dinucleotide biosynthesis protein A